MTQGLEGGVWEPGVPEGTQIWLILLNPPQTAPAQTGNLWSCSGKSKTPGLGALGVPPQSRMGWGYGNGMGWGYGDMGTWGQGDRGTWGYGDGDMGMMPPMGISHSQIPVKDPGSPMLGAHIPLPTLLRAHTVPQGTGGGWNSLLGSSQPHPRHSPMPIPFPGHQHWHSQGSLHPHPPSGPQENFPSQPCARRCRGPFLLRKANI